MVICHYYFHTKLCVLYVATEHIPHSIPPRMQSRRYRTDADVRKVVTRKTYNIYNKYPLNVISL